MLYVALAGCTAAAAALVYRYDLYDREPRRLLLLAAALGFAAMPVAGAVESAAIAGLRLHSAGEVALLAGAVEETAKLLAVVGVALLARRHFNDPMDGLVYGSVAGLGMALEEGAAVLAQMQPPPALLPGGELVRILLHLLFGGVGSWGLGALAARERRWPVSLAGSLGAATGLHALWDWIVLWPATGGGPEQTGGAIGVMLAALGGYGALVARASERSRLVFAPASAPRLWGWPFQPRRGR